MPDILEQLETLGAQEHRVAMATLVAARGGSPRPLGAKLFVGEGGRLLGSVSIGGCVDARVVEHGDRLLRERRSREKVTVVVDDAEALELGLACGAEFDLLIEAIALDKSDETVGAYVEAARVARSGRTAFVVTNMSGGRDVVTEHDLDASPDGAASNQRVAKRLIDRERQGAYLSAGGDYFIERIAPADTLVLVGASDVAASLARLARSLGLRVVVVDGRDRYATRDRFASADELLVGMPSELVRPHLQAGAYVVLAAHEYKYELPILREALRSPVRFVGMLAGRKRADAVRALLRDEGLSEEEVGRLHAPIGLDIGGREPEEIALSIAAQLVAVREGKPIARRPDREHAAPAPTSGRPGGGRG
jgi:xanthine dehydrogenase accessory factor